MEYKVTIFGKRYELPARTLTIDEKIEELSGVEEKYSSGELSRRDLIEMQYDFIQYCVPGIFGEEETIDTVDTNDLLKACTDIIQTYIMPTVKIQTENEIAQLRELLNRPEISKTLKLAEISRNVSNEAK